jgi:phage FluMu gp28-like protein
MPYKQQEQLFKLIAKALPNFSKGAHDATGNGGYLAEAMQLHLVIKLKQFICLKVGIVNIHLTLKLR